MQLVKCNKDKVSVAKGMPGLIEVEFEHTISATKAAVLYQGPPIDPDLWNQILGFFKWTWLTTHSESQVRLFVNPTRKIWDAWAAPQEARTGMSAREIDNEEARKQRQAYSDVDGWIYFGTVHHHCSAGAFQSGTDEWNEKTQDGLHITIGKMGDKVHDMHCRFYVGGAQFDPDMSLFWDIGENVRGLLPPKFYNEIARHQMCVSPGMDQLFPELWKNNLIEIKTVGGYNYGGGGVATQGFFHGAGSGGSYDGGSGSYLPGSWSRDVKTRDDMLKQPLWRRGKIASYKFMEYTAAQGIPWETVNNWIKEQCNDENLVALIEILVHCSIDLGDLWREFPVGAPSGYDELRGKFDGEGEPGKKRGRKKKAEVTVSSAVPPHVRQLPEKTGGPVSIPVHSINPEEDPSNPMWGGCEGSGY